MAGSRRLSKPPTHKRTPVAEKGPEALLRAAERLFAEHSVEDVSMRQIVVAAGQANHYAVQHHFGDKQGLVRAILQMRLPEVNAIREQMIVDAGGVEALDAAGLVRVLFLPLARFVDEAGRHTHARFMLRLQQRETAPSVMLEFYDDSSLMAAVVDALRARLSHLAEPVFALRLRLTSHLFLHAALALDSPDAMAGMSADTLLAHTLQACHSVLAHPDTVSSHREQADQAARGD